MGLSKNTADGVKALTDLQHLFNENEKNSTNAIVTVAQSDRSPKEKRDAYEAIKHISDNGGKKLRYVCIVCIASVTILFSIVAGKQLCSAIQSSRCTDEDYCQESNPDDKEI